ncbi:hypothetical protein [uncultured Brevundimonas sp.]|uniref:hypothetical protein n=1 Tax=uncultured Brevundimonas sp. TaxID=213418 RepID=UPI0025D839E3|nr:hypothetical protein [uncultured Brevundimonas sp.]
MIRHVAIASVALGLMAGPALAQSRDIAPADLRDVECMAVVAVAGGAAEEGSDEQIGLIGGLMYFLGRLEGRTPGTDWLSYFGTYIQAPDIEKKLEAHYERCGQEMIDKGAALEEFGEIMQAKAAAAD